MSVKKPGTLSNGTLSLKFMQRGVQDAKVTLTQAKVKDEGEWEIGREAWEALGANGEPKQDVSYENSYLPFLLPSLAERAPAARSSLPDGGGGRRSFGKFNKALEQKDPSEPEEPPKPPPDPGPRPQAISRYIPGMGPSREPWPEELAAAPRQKRPTSGFQRPAGIDAPRGASRLNRGKGSGFKRKREPGESESPVKKSKKPESLDAIPNIAFR